MLYTEDLYKLGDPKGIFGFADDVARLIISPALDQNVAGLQEEALKLISWGRRNGLKFDMEKTELQHFTRKRDPHRPPIRIEDTEIPPASKALRYLGVFLDSKLSFREHVQIRAAKARTTAIHLCRINRTRLGAPAHLLRQAALAAVSASLYFGIEAWFPGQSLRRRDKDISTRISSLIAICDRVQNIALRGILPVYRTTPVTALQREGGFLPAALALELRRLRFAARLRSLDPYHPLVARSQRPSRPTITPTRLQRTMALLPGHCPRPQLLTPTFTNRAHALSQIGYSSQPKEHAANDFRRWQASLRHMDITVFTDGSQQEEHTGAGCYGKQGNIEILREQTPLGPQQEVFDAEVFAAVRGLQLALDSPGTHLASNIYICLDNLEVAVRLLHLDPPDTSQELFLRFRELAAKWPARRRLPHIPTGSVQIRWCPGHQGIPGNEEADKEAKLATLRAPETATSSVSSLRRIAQQQIKDKALAHWTASAPQRYQDFHIPWKHNTPQELFLQRQHLGPLLAARTGHGDFQSYHERFNHENANLTCTCGKSKTPEHFFFCTKGRRRSRALLLGPPRLQIPELLGTPKGAQRFAAWAAHTKFFTEICGR